MERLEICFIGGLAPRWLSASVFLLVLSALVPGWSFAQKSDLENELKNLPKVPGTPAPPNMGSGPTRLNPLGPYLQEFTGVQFPERVGGFERRGVDLYDAEARDVGASYERTGGSRGLLSIITVFSYPVPPSLESGGIRAVFDDAKAAILSKSPGAKLGRDGTYRAPDGSSGFFAEYTIRNFRGKKGTVPVRSRLYLFGSGGWLLKFRATYPEWRAREASTELESFIRSFGTGVMRGKLGV